MVPINKHGRYEKIEKFVCMSNTEVFCHERWLAGQTQLTSLVKSYTQDKKITIAETFTFRFYQHFFIFNENKNYI